MSAYTYGQDRTSDNGVRFCMYCGTKLDIGARFCKKCGKPVIKKDEESGSAASGTYESDESKRWTYNDGTGSDCNAANWESYHRWEASQGSKYSNKNYSKESESYEGHSNFEDRATGKDESYKEYNNGSGNGSDKRELFYDGVIHKCPKCGETLNSFVPTCPACGYELRGTKVVSKTAELAEMLQGIESEERKIELIRNFYIPNTKEEICEFFILAVSNIEAGSYGIGAWYAKMEQAYQKGKLLFGDSSEFDYFQELYDKTNKGRVKKRMGGIILRSKALPYVVIGLIGVILVVFGVFVSSAHGGADSPYIVFIIIGQLLLSGLVLAILISFSSEYEKRKRDDMKTNGSRM